MRRLLLQQQLFLVALLVALLTGRFLSGCTLSGLAPAYKPANQTPSPACGATAREPMNANQTHSPSLPLNKNRAMILYAATKPQDHYGSVSGRQSTTRFRTDHEQTGLDLLHQMRDHSGTHLPR